MTDDVIVSGGTVTFRQNLWKRVFQAVSCALLIALGVVVLVIATGEQNILMQGLGVLMIIFFLYAGYKALTSSRIALIASAEGIMPMYLAPENRTLIPWSNIERMEKAVQSVKSSKTSYLAFYLREPLPQEGEKMAMMRRVLGGSMSDGAIADAYVPEILLPEKVEKVIERLEALRPKTS